LSTIWQNKGFTLLELLVALTLLVMLSGTLYGTWFTVIRGRDTATARMDNLREVRSTLDMLRRELASAYYKKDNKRLHFIVEDRDSFGKPSSLLDFTTITTPLAGSVPSADIVAVRYSPDEKNGKIRLMREETEIYLQNKPVSYPQMEELQGFLVECYDGSKWVKSWNTDPTLNNRLPEAVRVTLTIQEGDNIQNYSAVTGLRIENP
jgi:general secretion pathway protein J